MRYGAKNIISSSWIMGSLNMITFYSYDANIYAAELIITTDNVIAGS